MRYHILATDYDGTIAHHGKVKPKTIEALKQLKESGRKIVLVTGRELDELMTIFPEYGLFDLIVAENGALIYHPATMEEFLLGEQPPADFIQALHQQEVTPLSIGKVIVATWEPHQNKVLETIKHFGLEHQVIFNKGAVMILPPGINKSKGLHTALQRIHYSIHNTVAVGDAENDNAMLQAAECSVAVANALPSVKEAAAVVTKADHGEGVEEMIVQLLENDLASADERLIKHYLPLGKHEDESDFCIAPYRKGVLLAGSSGGGKSTLTIAFLESLVVHAYQFCLVDPEGDYIDFPSTVVLGDPEKEPSMEELKTLLKTSSQNVVLCVLAIPIDKRPAFFNEFLLTVNAIKHETGHPHWILLDEAHHLLPAKMEDSFFKIPESLNNIWLITTQPSLVNKAIMQNIGSIIAIGSEPHGMLHEFSKARNLALNASTVKPLEQGKAWVWNAETNKLPFIISTNEPRHIAKRHKRKYAKGNMDYNSFYFTGPEKKLHLKAYNIVIFTELAEGVDDETWMFHLKRNDYSKWFRYLVHDDELADLTKQVEDTEDNPRRSRDNIINLVRERYTAEA
ncbi:HAD family hydrolase [Foetidibacter luteolus]|uniref:HAD-IIB family hydrolase n=1 Tax=Foetidibacter luteolus TaxID=2608880 RepID=UPI00129ABAC2|nr:HAD family hydrolase [Foetidibacter luteolus]